ncbi:MAG TPA: uroporphyrinogen decarboxylase family protein [Thermodesulfobacteriota bacterium]|nr:uroporphyrinogen decarboxylase family protein [Thermodesulfobacteriota bacterium]
MADALRTRPFDYVPVLPFVAGWAAARFSKDPPARIYRDPQRMAEVQIKAQETLGFDGLFGHLDPLHIPAAFGCPIHFTETGPIVQPLQPALETVAQVDALPFPDPQHSGRLPEILQTARLLAEYGQDRIPFIGLFEGPFTSACRLFETDRLMRMLYKNPPVLNRLLDRVTEFLLLFAQALRDQGARFLLIPEPTASGSMISPRMFDEWVLPRLQGIMRNIDLPCSLHICGDTSALLRAMAQTGARVLSLDQCMDLKTARVGIEEVALGGNVDPVKSLLLGSPQTVRENTWNCLRQAGTQRFILMSGCSVPPGTPEENLRVMIEAAREFGLGQTESSSIL